MPNKKLTDSEIIEALECCKNDEIICMECPYKKAKGCMKKLSADALDLINRLLAENENCYKFIKQLKEARNLWEDKCKELQAENEQKDKNYIELKVELFDKTEQLNVELQAMRGMANSYKAENEKLQNILICFMDALGKVRKVDDIDEISLIPLMSELNKQYRAELKAEAIKEFAERLDKASFITSYTTGFGGKDVPIKHITMANVYSILKDLVGDKHNA